MLIRIDNRFANGSLWICWVIIVATTSLFGSTGQQEHAVQTENWIALGRVHKQTSCDPQTKQNLRDIRRFKIHTDEVTGVAFSLDSQRAITASNDRTAHLWNVQTGILIYTFDLTPQASGELPVYSGGYSADERYIFTRNPESIRFWDAQTGILIVAIPDTSIHIDSVKLSPDRQWLAVGDAFGETRLWELPKGVLRHTLKGHTEDIRSVQFSSDSQRLLTAGSDRNAQIWDVQTGKRLFVLEQSEGALWIFRAIFSSEGRYVLTQNFELAELWDSGNGKFQYSLSVHSLEQSANVMDQVVINVAFHPEGAYVITKDSTKSTSLLKIRLWDIRTGKLVRVFCGNANIPDVVLSVVFSPDGKYLFAFGGDDAQLWEIHSGTLIHSFSESRKRITNIAFSNDGKSVLAGLSDGSVELWQIN